MVISEEYQGLNSFQTTVKRSFDFFTALLGILLTGWVILPSWLVAGLDTRDNGFFTQKRVGRNGKLFSVIKIRTMRSNPGLTTTVTSANDKRITNLGRFFRKAKIDELPQLINVLKGEMSFVGPRPDVPGYADRLKGTDRLILSVRPGITGPATLKYRNEESILAFHEDPETYNIKYLWPDKVRLNREYVETWSFKKDLIYLWQTLFSKN